MDHRIRILYYALWIAHPLLEMGILALLVRRQLHRKFPYFFGYIVTQLLGFAVVFPTLWHHQNYAACFYLYWLCQAVSVAFGFGVIHEVFVDVFRSFYTLRDLGTVLFKWAGVVMLLVAAVVSVSANSSQMFPWMQAIITTQRCVRIIQVGMVLFLLLFAQYLGVSRRQQSFGLALGFGSFAIVELALVASWVGNHLRNPWMSIVNMSAYNLSLMIWVRYVAAKNSAEVSASSRLQTQRWEQSLSDLHSPVPTDSLIPMFEGMVDRALSRTQPGSPFRSSDPAPGARAAAAASASSFSVPPVRVDSRS